MEAHQQDPIRSAVSRAVERELDATVVIVNYNHDELLYRCVDSILRSRQVPVEVNVVDNNSVSPPLNIADDGVPLVKVIANKRNLGFARAANRAIERAGTKYILLLNPDTVVKPDTIGNMVEFMEENPDVGLAGCKMFYPDGTLQWSCRTFYTPITILFRRSPLGKLWPNNPVSRKHLMADWDHATARPVDWMLGACLMARREAIEVVGLLDENFFLYFEDVDWCYRMQQHGWKVYYFPGAEIVHHHIRASAHLNRVALHHVRSMVYYYRKHFLSNLLPESRKIRRRARLLERALRFQGMSHWRRAWLTVSYLTARALSAMADFAYGKSRGRAPDLLTAGSVSEMAADTDIASVVPKTRRVI